MAKRKKQTTRRDRTRTGPTDQSATKKEKPAAYWEAAGKGGKRSVRGKEFQSQPRSVGKQYWKLG